MWYCPDKYNRKLPNINQQILDIKGEMEDKEAKITLAKFLRHNVGFTTELITGIKLAPYQEITLKGFLNKNFSMCVWGRGIGKTFVASVFCFLQCVFEPGTKILIAGPTFRTARFIFENLEKIVDSKGAELLMQCFDVKSKRNDQFKWEINGGSITAIPLNGEKIRGFRANILVLDEYLLLPEEIIRTVLMPFLVAPQNMKERIEVREIEDKLIAEGRLKEEERMVFKNDSKLIALSSASYTFENLYRQYKEWIENVYSPEIQDSSYFVSQMSYESIPEHMIDQTIIEEAKNGGQSHSSFLREYCAQFSDGSDSYFSAKKMHECTVLDGNDPTTKIYGDRDKKYIVAIDPSFSNSPSSDYFAMAVLELNDDTKQGTLVNNYAVAGGDLKDHIEYLHYIMTSFNVEMVIIDNAGFQFIDSCNENKLFIDSKINLSFFDFDSILEDTNYQLETKRARVLFNKEAGKICFKQIFSTDFLRKSNEYLQANIDHKKIWFASKATANPIAFEKYSNFALDIEKVKEPSLLDFIETQDSLIYQVKKQCALIEVKSTAKGTQSFDIPANLKRSVSANRVRKDNYTALLLGNWAIKCYYDIMTTPKEESSTFVPRMI